MKEVIIGNITIAYTVRESERSKKLTMHVTPGNVEVVVPKNTTEDLIEKFVQRKRYWLFEKVTQVDEAARKRNNVQPMAFTTGAKIPYRGRMMKLHVSKRKVTGVHVKYSNGFHVTVPSEMKETDSPVRQHLESWMKKRLEMDCKSFVDQYSKKLDVSPKTVKVKEQKHLWGSCSKDGTVNINWHLVFAPKQILEYVVVHELCHLKYRNHSKQFWHLLGSVFPDWEKCKVWLENNEQVWEMRV